MMNKIPCHYCGYAMRIRSSDSASWLECQKCGVLGPLASGKSQLSARREAAKITREWTEKLNDTKIDNAAALRRTARRQCARELEAAIRDRKVGVLSALVEKWRSE